ncbi:MAG: response regulator [Polyangiales bacterium]
MDQRKPDAESRVRHLARRRAARRRLVAGGSGLRAQHRDFTKGLAHEIRNPLNSALLELTVLGRRLAAAGDAASAASAAVARAELTRLGKLVGEALDADGSGALGSDWPKVPRAREVDPVAEGATDVAEAASASVLVIDDNEQNRTLARMTLESDGYAVTLAASGAEGLEAASRAMPDCVLLDVRMPHMDGFEVCARLRAMPGGAELPVIFVTALRDVETFDRAMELGGADFLTKPVQPVELSLRVRQVVRLRRLDAEFSAQLQELQHQQRELFRVQLQKEDLAAFIVHDLKNPVNAIDLEAQLILRDPKLSPRARESAQQIRARIRDLLGMILDLLDTARAEQGRLGPDLAPVSLSELVAQVIESRAGQAAEAGVTVEPHVTAATLRADADLLRRVIENLVENALRYAPRGSAVGVTAADAGDWVELAVSDRGPGVPPALRETVFDRYARFDQGSARTSRGLGLAFCRVAVEAHGGAISVEDNDPGARFVVRLPRGEAVD